ncbi:MAG: GHKL domain-containing protein [Lachnospiraceae bacterium]|nr:GHKL domain-containing protein [Lachnospiraceae bacterium]
MNYLDKIILFFSCVFEIYVYYDFFHAYLNFRSDDRASQKRIFLGLLAVIGLFIVNTFEKLYINIGGFITVVWTYYILIFQADIGIRILYFIIAFVVGYGCKFLYGILVNVSINVKEQSGFIYLSDIPWQMFTVILSIYVFFAIIKHFFGLSKKTMNYKKFIQYLCISIVSILIMISTFYWGIGSSVNCTIKLLLSVSFAFMLFENMFVFNVLQHYSKESHINAEQKLIISRQEVELYRYEQIQKSDIQYLDFIHNINHHLRTIGQLAKESKNSNIISILQDINIKIESNVLTMYCTNPVVNAVLSEKKAVAEEKKLVLDIYVEPGVTLMGIADADIITMLSNLLDNALQAAENAEDKLIIVRIYLENEGCFHIIKIENYYTGELYSTVSGFASTNKEKGLHGIGIKSIKNTAEKYDGYLEYLVDNRLFTAILVLPSL